jgi:hypothetical protein
VPPIAAPSTAAAVPPPSAVPLPAVPQVTRESVPAPAEPNSSSDEGGSGGGPVVHAGSYCDPPGTGVTSKGTPMVCRPAKDGRNRWQKA